MLASLQVAASLAIAEAATALSAGKVTDVAIDTAVYGAVTVFKYVVAKDDEVFQNKVDLTVGVTLFLKQALKGLSKRNPLAVSMDLNSLAFTAVSLISNICARDPPDSSYEVVALPQKLSIMKTGNTTVNKVQVDYLNYISLAGATIHEAERWQGATLAKAEKYAVLQNNAFNKYASEMIAAKNVLKTDNLTLAKALPVG
jgi:hypothetical protein